MTWRSLHIKLALTVTSGALLVVAVSSVFFYQRTYEASLQESQRSVRQLLETVQNTAAIAAYVGNQQLAQDVANGLGKNDLVLGVEIRSTTSSLARIGQNTMQTGDNVLVLPLSSPFAADEAAGELRVQVDRSLIAKRARDDAETTTVMLALQAAVVALLVLVGVYWMMTRPLSYLSMRLHRITPGASTRLKIARRHHGDEIGVLVDDINGLLSTVERMLQEERHLRQQVELLEHRFRGIFEDSSAGIFLLNVDGNLVTANPAFFRLTGLSAQEQMQLGQRDCVPDIFLDADQARGLIKLALTSHRPCSADLRLAMHSESNAHWSHCIFSPGQGDSGNQIVEGVIYDITARKQAEANTRRQAERDALTGLFNRQAIETLTQELVHQAQALQSGFIVMMLDLDRFKHINDTYGHDAGDIVLKVVAERLRLAVRDSDVIARLGGDEFLLLLPQTEQLDGARRIAGNLIQLISSPITLADGISERIGVSIGIAAYPRHSEDPHQVRKQADAALYEVKRQGRNGYAIRTDNGQHEVQLFSVPPP